VFHSHATVIFLSDALYSTVTLAVYSLVALQSGSICRLMNERLVNGMVDHGRLVNGRLVKRTIRQGGRGLLVKGTFSQRTVDKNVAC